MTSSVFVTDVDDYLAPSQACVNPLFTVPSSATNGNEPTTPSSNHNNDSVPLVVPRRRRRRLPPATSNDTETVTTMEVDHIDQPASFHALVNVDATVSDQDATPTTTTVVKATMADCLACSGCITTAETVLVEQHSVSALRSLCHQENEHKDDGVIVVTISPAAWADLLRHVGVSTSTTSATILLEWQRRLVQWWHQFFHVSMVIDGNIPLQWSLTEAANEFCQAHVKEQSSSSSSSSSVPEQQQPQHDFLTETNGASGINGHEATTPATDAAWNFDSFPSIALSATEAQYMLPDGTAKIVTTASADDASRLRRRRLPLFTSSCPALVCLVEKSTTSSTAATSSSTSASPASIANLASTKSPMSISGVLIKQVLFASEHSKNTVSTTRKRVRHIAVMPCHDKKLEASRKDFLYTTPLEKTSSASTTKSLTLTPTTTDEESDRLEPSVDLVITTQEWWTLVMETFQQQQESSASMSEDKAESNESSSSSNLDDIQTWIQSLAMAPVMDLVEYWNKAAQEHEDVMFLADGLRGTEQDNVTQENATVPMDIDSKALNDSGSTVFSMGSGGYADFVFRHAAQHFFGHVITDNPLPWTPFSATSSSQQQPILRGRRRRLADSKPADMYQLRLFRHGDGSFSCHEKDSTQDRVVLRFGMAYGLQNVQRMLQQGAGNNKLVSSSLPPSFPVFDYVEAMACPMGCVNGGGQIRVAARETPSETRQRVMNTQKIFSQLYDHPAGTTNNDNKNGDSVNFMPAAGVRQDVSVLLSASTNPFPQKKHLLHTNYHVVPPLQYAQGATKGVAVSDLRW